MTTLRRLLFAVLLTAVGAAASAQTAGTFPDSTEWQGVAEQVEQALAVGVITNSALEELREHVADWREQFLAAKTLNASRLATIDRRLAALPAAPPEGEFEPAPISEERMSLIEQRQRLEEPAIRADLAFAHADGLVREIDETLRERQALELAERLPTPLNPLSWLEPLAELGAVARAVPGEIRDVFIKGESRDEALKMMPAAVVTGLVGLILLSRAGAWTAALMRAGHYFKHPLTVFTLDSIAVLLQLVLPVSGLVLFLVGVGISGILGETGTVLLQGLSTAALQAVLGAWLVVRIYPHGTNAVYSASSVLPDRLAGRARRTAMWLVALLGVEQGLSFLADPLDLQDRTAGYLVFAALLPLAFVLFRVGHLYRITNLLAARPENEPKDGRQFTLRVLGGVARLGQLIALIGPVLALVGYLNAAEALVVPACYTFLLLAGIGRLQILVAEVFTMVRHGDPDAATGLWPTLIGGMLYVLSLPILALIWGARYSDLSEVWASLRSGFTLGGVHLSPGVVILFMLVFVLGLLMTRFVQGLLSQAILPKTRLDIGAQRAITSGSGYIGVMLAVLVAITSTGIDLSSVAIVAGALSVGIGFGLQTIVSNFVSGIILLIERPVSEGDWIEVGGQMGYVRAISVRATRIETFDRTDVIVPNSDLVSGMVTNWTRGNLIGRAIVPVGVAYGSDTYKVERILQEIAEAHPMVAISPPPLVLFVDFGPSSLNFEIRAILRDINFVLTVKSEMNHEIVRRFAEEGIEIPFPQRDLWIRNADAVRPVMHPSGEAIPPRTQSSSRDMMTQGDLGDSGADR